MSQASSSPNTRKASSRKSSQLSRRPSRGMTRSLSPPTSTATSRRSPSTSWKMTGRSKKSGRVRILSGMSGIRKKQSGEQDPPPESQEEKESELAYLLWPGLEADFSSSSSSTPPGNQHHPGRGLEQLGEGEFFPRNLI